MANYEVHYLNVSDADAIIIRYRPDNGETFTVLVDAGNVSDGETIKDYLWNKWKTRIIDLAICTHPDSDHKGGFFTLLNDREITIKEFWLNDPRDVIPYNLFKLVYPKGDYEKDCLRCLNHPTDETSPDLLTLALSKNCNVYGAYKESKHDIIPITVIGPSKDFYKPLAWDILANNKPKRTSHDEGVYDEVVCMTDEEASSSIDKEPDDPSPTNAGSIILLFQPSEKDKYLLTGDANRAAILDALKCKYDITSCHLKVPHHGSKHNMTSQIINALSPKYAIISAKGTKKHPSPGIVHCLSKHCDVYSTHKTRGALCHNAPQPGKSAVPLKRCKK